MTITTRRLTLEVFRGSHVFLKIGRYEMFLNLSREEGEDRFSWTRGEREGESRKVLKNLSV